MVPKSAVQRHPGGTYFLHSTGHLERLEQYSCPARVSLLLRPLIQILDTGAGGQQEPYLVNGANALTFG